MDWYDVTGKFHELTLSQECRLSSLPEEWQRELAALWRLEADVNNSSYLQFAQNWERESYVYASQGLKKIGARKMSSLIEQCQAIVDEKLSSNGVIQGKTANLMPGPRFGFNGEVAKEAGSILPDRMVNRVLNLSYKFMDYPDDLVRLGTKYYGQYTPIEGPAASVESGDSSVARARFPNIVKKKLIRFLPLRLLGWLSILGAGRFLQTGREDLALLAAIGGVGSIYLGSKISVSDSR